MLLCFSCKICFHEETALKFLFSWRFLLRHWKSKSSLPALSLRSKTILWTYSSNEICLGWGVIWIAYEASVFDLWHLQSYLPVSEQFSVWLQGYIGTSTVSCNFLFFFWVLLHIFYCIPLLEWDLRKPRKYYGGHAGRHSLRHRWWEHVQPWW